MATRRMTNAERREKQRLAKLAAGRRKHKPFKPREDHPRCTVQLDGQGRGKLRYKSREAAENVLREIMVRGSAKQLAFRVYLCPHCEGYHHTSQPKRSAD